MVRRLMQEKCIPSRLLESLAFRNLHISCCWGSDLTLDIETAGPYELLGARTQVDLIVLGLVTHLERRMKNL